MRSKVTKIPLLIITLITVAMFIGCTHTEMSKPEAVAIGQQPQLSLPEAKRIPIKVGLYVSEDLKRYVYKQQKMDIILHMNVGEHVTPISKQLAAKMFRDVILVDSLPPYTGQYRPDVDAVVEPEILYFYGNAIGTASGHIEAAAKMRITVYDPAGKIVWQDEALGENRSTTAARGMDEIGRTVYRAVFDAATKIIGDFNGKPPRGLNSLLESEKITALRNQRNIPNFDMFKDYYENGQYQFKKKNFHKALSSFEKAESINPGDPLTTFYVGVCLFYTAQKDKATAKFQQVVRQNPGTQEAKDSTKWLDLLKEPLKIGMVVLDTGKGTTDPIMMPADNVINTTIGKSPMYELVNVGDLSPPADASTTKNLNQFLEKSAKNGVVIILYVVVNDLTSKAPIQQKGDGEMADEFSVRLVTKVFSTRKKQQRTEITVTERTSVLGLKTSQEGDALKRQLQKRGAEKLVLRLLENDIF
jgi:tetratricopeptide (TPR) repeat protein